MHITTIESCWGDINNMGHSRARAHMLPMQIYCSVKKNTEEYLLDILPSLEKAVFEACGENILQNSIFKLENDILLFVKPQDVKNVFPRGK